MSKFLKLWLLPPLLAAYLTNTAAAADDGVFKVTFDKSYSVTTVQLPNLCHHERAERFCTLMSNYFSRSFERELIMEQTANIDFDDPNFQGFNPVKARQNVFIFFLQNKTAPIASLYALCFQYFDGEEKSSRRKVVTFNFDIESERNLAFADLFEDSELAAMLIARKLEAHYQNTGSPFLPMLVTATEYRPTNFVVVEDGIRMFFAPGVVDPDESKMQSFKIELKDLMEAGPKAKWWPSLAAAADDAKAKEEGAASAAAPAPAEHKQ